MATHSTTAAFDAALDDAQMARAEAQGQLQRVAEDLHAVHAANTAAAKRLQGVYALLAGGGELDRALSAVRADPALRRGRRNGAVAEIAA